MARFLLVCMAGAAGTGVRYLVGLAAARLIGTGFPWGTLAVNVVGCLLMSIVAEAGTRTIISHETRVVLATGFMGGLTTYSAYNWETIAMARDGAWTLGVVYATSTFVACVTSGLAGLVIARAAFGN